MEPVTTAHTLKEILSYAVLFLGAFLGLRFRPMSDLQRAELLKHMAESAASEILGQFPTLADGQLAPEVVKSVLATPGAPTKNLRAVQRAAALALAVVRTLKVARGPSA